MMLLVIRKYLLALRPYRRLFSTTLLSVADIPIAHVKKGKETFYTAGSPIIYNTSIARVTCERDVQAGEEIVVKDYKGVVLGRGVYNPFSMYRVRMLALASERNLMEISFTDLIDARISMAKRLRVNCFLPSDETNAFRLINSEGDNLSGLFVDVYGDVAVAQSSALWIERHKITIIASLQHALGDNTRIIWKQSKRFLDMDGHKSCDNLRLVHDNEERGTSKVIEEITQPIDIMENGLVYRVFPGYGQKTGFYCDQRSNRALIGTLCKGKRVLDLYCFCGGFSLNALKGECQSVIGVDSSMAAIDAARTNLSLNPELDSDKATFVEFDAVEYLQKSVEEGSSYDLIILDPPKFAPNAKSLLKATQKYKLINELAMRLIDRDKGGLLFTCSCSGAISQSLGKHQSIIASAATKAERIVKILSNHETGLGDHPSVPSFSESIYFTASLVHVT